MRWILWTGMCLLVLSLALAAFLFGTHVSYPRKISPVQLGSGFTGALPLPLAEVQSAIDAANKGMLASNNRGRAYATAVVVALWISFFTSSLVTLVAGLTGHRAGAFTTTKTGSPAKAARWLGVLGAVAAVSTAFSGLAKQQSESAYRCVDEVRTLVRDTLNDIDGIAPDLARQYLAELLLEVTRCQ